jgi:hypothetical protein
VITAFNLRSRRGREPDEIDFANALGLLHDDYELIRRVANASKHHALRHQVVPQAVV